MIYFESWKKFLVILICLLGIIYTLPNFLSKTHSDWMVTHLPDWMPGKTINLGLDLRGGSQLLLEVDLDAVIKDRLNLLMASVKKELRQNHINFRNLHLVTNDHFQGIEFELTNQNVSEEDRLSISKLLSRLEERLDIYAQGNNIRISFTQAAYRDRRDLAIAQSIEIVRRRVDETGTKEPSIQRQGEDRILVQLPGFDDPEMMKKMLGKTAKLSFYLVDDQATMMALKTGAISSVNGQDKMVLSFQGNQSKKLVVDKTAQVTGEMLVDAQPSFNQGNPVVSFKFDSTGARKFGELTSQHVGSSLAIVLDGEIISAPRINTAIVGGSGFIEGNFTVQSAHDLALLLRSGALPAPIKVIEERTVGPGLGADSIHAGKMSAYIGAVCVVVFMIVAYGLFGVFANIALFFNVSLIFAALSAFQASLTLPGIAAIILTMGMAVDANVLIYERMREEMRQGRTAAGCIEAGYSQALSAIVDSNLTTLIAGLLLVWFGSGPVKGFGISLSIGIITSMFTAIMVSRLIIATWYLKTKPKVLPI